jgi:uncharacterized repeat protein (TIGR03803 family)
MPCIQLRAGCITRNTIMLVLMLGLITITLSAQTYSVLYNFTGGSDGGEPYGQVTLDASGNLYGTASIGGADGNGVVWQITP